MLIVDMEASITRYCLSLLLLTSIRTSASSDDEIISNEPREPRVSGRIVKLYSGAKPQPYLCPGEGFQPDLNNCAVFYRCVKEISGKFTVFRYQCAPGTVYDIDLETCNHPQSTRRSECGGMLKPTAVPDLITNINDIDVAQSEVPRPISTKIPIYTEQTTLKTPTLTLVLSTERHNTPPKKQWKSTTYTSPIKLDSSEDKSTKFASSTARYQWLSTKHQAESTSPPNTIQSFHVQNDDQCMSDGFMGDSENCRKFYRCVRNQRGGYVKYEFSCSELTIWDDEIQGCNHPWAVKRSKCGRSLSYSDRSTSQKPDTHPTEKLTTQGLIMNNGGYGYKSNKTTQQQLQMSYGSTSSQTQIQISNNDQVVQNQTQIHHGDTKEKNNKPGLIQNQKQQSYGTAVSQIQTQLDYGHKGVQTQVQIDHSKDSSQSQVQIHEGTTVPLTSTEHHNNIKSNECSESGFMGDPNDCKKFYRCVNNGRGTYTKFEYFCGDGTVWDPEVEACNHEWAVQHCGGKHSSEPTMVIPTNTTTTTMKSTVSQTEPTRTTQSYYTTSKVPNTDDEDDIGYGNQNNHNTTPPSTTTMKPTTATMKLTTSSIVNSNETYTECTSSGFIGDLNDCKIFYRCVNSGEGKFIKYEFKCGDGTLWDPDIEACNHAWAVKHCGGKVPSEPTADNHTTTSTTSTKSTDYNTEPTKTTQSSDVTDEEDVGYGNQNNQDTSSSSATTTTTIKSTSTTSEKSNGAENKCISSGFMGDANDCKVFYRCVDNGNGAYVKYEFKCGDGTLWDPDIEACNHAWAVKNCRDTKPNTDNKEETTTRKENTTPPTDMQTTITLIQITNQGPTQNDDYDTGYGSQNSVTSSIVTTTEHPQEHENHKNSQCKSSGFIGDENDCKKFYRCVDDGNGNYIRYEFTCGEGTVWDPTIEACNHAWAVEKCGGSNPVITSTETSSQPILTTNNGDTSIMFTTQSNKDTENPTSTNAITSSTATSSGTNDKCSNGGFIGDDSNCKKFYRCVDNGDGTYTRYEFTCGDGTVWDPKIEACNHAWAVEKCGGTTASTQHDTQQPTMLDEEQGNGYATPSYETSEKPSISTSTPISNGITSVNSVHCNTSGFMGDKNDCKKFYRCVDNGKGGYDHYEFNCGEGTHWDQSIEACNHAWAVKDCKESGLSTTQFQHESTSQSNPISEEDHAQQSTEKTTTISQIHHENEPSGGKCVQEGFFGNNYDCKKFYRCVDNGLGTFHTYEFTCGEGTLWNQDKQSCDHASDVLCSVSSQDPIHLNDDMDSQTISSTKTTTSTTVEETNTTQVTKKPQLSQNKCESEGFYGNSSDCKKFYRCVANGSGGYTKYDFSCGDGTVWNQDMLACDHEAADKTCTSTSSSQSQVTLSQLESTTNSYSTTMKQNSTHITSESTNNDCTSDGFYAHPKDCKKFIRCVSNGRGQYTRYEFSCGDGTVWVQEIQACDHDNEVSSCSIQDSNSISKPENHEQYPSNTPNGNVISSTEGVTPYREDDEYDPGISKDPSHDETDDCTSEGYFANKQDCRKFHRCVDNGNGGYTKYDFTCGDGTAWDSDLQTCNHINQVQSCSGSSQDGNSNQQTTTNKNEAQTNNSYTTTQATMSTSSLESSESNTNSEDKCKSEGYFGDSKDCKKFYRCVDNGKGSYTKYDFTCGDGTIWDQDISNCNHPQDVSNPTCTSEPGSTDITSTTSSTTSSSQITTSTTENSNNSQGTSDCTEESSKKPENNDISCDKAGYYANPNDCKKFYRCVDWDGDGQKFSVFHFECGEGTIWDPALDTCNHEDSVYPQRDCSKGQSQNVGGDTTTAAGTTSTTITPSSTSEQTTQESATIEQTTTPQSVTSEQTTSEQSTNEQTTTQQSTTSEKSTTQESTSEQTTAQETKPTSDKTTILESTTTEQTQPTTTTQKTTTQESTTNEHTTTQQSTTSAKTTTQGSSTSDKSTTQEPTTNEQATMQPHTTSEPTTTTKSTTDEQTTTQQSENTTTQETATSELTQQSTTSEYTTEEPTTNQQTTIPESTMSQQTTTQESTTSQQTTTQESTISSTQPSTTTEAVLETTSTEQTTVQQSTMTDQTTTQQLTSDQTTTESSNEQSSTISTEVTTTTEATQTSSTESDPTDYQSTTEMSSSNKDCPETEHDQYLLVCPTSFKRHPKYCNMFYQCIEDEDTNEAKVATFKCPNNTIYDETQTQCLTEDKAGKKCHGEIANKRRFKRLNANYKDPIVADKGKQSCATAGYFSFEKQSECSKGFLKCEKSKNGQVKGHVYQCPDGFIYWSISKRCERVESVRDCKRSFNDWTGRWNIPVERNNIATS